MQVKKSDLWESKADLIAVTTCGSLEGSSRRLMMVQGAAYQAARRYPKLPIAAGHCVEDEMITQINNIPLYGFLVVKMAGGQSIGLFQSKLHYAETAFLSVIGTSVAILRSWVEKNPEKTISINFPGIGLGGLERQTVEPLLLELPNCVTFHVL